MAQVSINSRVATSVIVDLQEEKLYRRLKRNEQKLHKVKKFRDMWRQASLEDETITENSGGTPSVRAQGGGVTRLEGVSHVLFFKLGGVNIHCLS